jgi:uncharacterized protein YjbI with pentapeptide repeats
MSSQSYRQGLAKEFAVLREQATRLPEVVSSPVRPSDHPLDSVADTKKVVLFRSQPSTRPKGSVPARSTSTNGRPRLVSTRSQRTHKQEPKRRELVNGSLTDILSAHRKWVASNGREGKQANVERAKLAGANLQRAILGGANLREANLSGADLRGTISFGVNLQRANLFGANLEEAVLGLANLEGADLVGANLRGVDLSDANLQDANLIAADLQGADLRGANLQGADLRGANLRNVIGLRTKD